VLPAAGGRLQAARNVGIETNAPAAQLDRLEVLLLGAGDRAATAAGTCVNGVVEGELEAVEQLLDVADVEATVEGLALSGLAFALGVCQINQLRGVGDEQATSPRRQAGRETQTVRPNRGRLIETIAVLVGQKLDSS